ncbi:hypothetical protein [Calothrix sp. PCC 7507]|uniref:hypothetical protein n=1 Tax=Calothrix sp. PCC 7507 TaxID=99598 RepID=UPI00029F17A0|nr:hypothetical protein [Calothrix sp. PCC 7507]AFY30727.1 hypothetical protein Cal7507_0226 [Calothrix sp. PCC 7507]
MTADVTSTATPNLAVISQAVAAYRGEGGKLPKAALLVDALLQAEKVAKQQRLAYNFESLLGKWRLCFATGTRKVRQRGGIVLGKGIYLPKFAAAYISFSADLADNSGRGEIGNQVQVGLVSLQLTGPAKYLGKKNLLAFDFTQMQISLFDRTVYKGQIRSSKAQGEDFHNQAIAKQAFFAFFMMTENAIAARGRGGGLALWIRET